jgi:hypothetical protein
MPELNAANERTGGGAERICELAQRSAAADDPDTALRALIELRGEVEAFVRVQVGDALAAGRSFSDVARTLGISRQAAHRRFRDLAPSRVPDGKRPLVATEAARRVERLGRAEAYAAGTPPGGEHILLGILRTDCEAARALRIEGVTLERARACLQSTARDGQDIRRTARGGQDTSSLRRTARDGQDTGSLRRILQQAALVALSRGRRELGPEELLVAALADPHGGASRMLAALAVEPASVRDRFGGRKS